MNQIRFSGKYVMNLVMVIISIGVVISAFNWPLKTALFPFILGGCGFILAVVELLLSLFGSEEPRKKQAAVDFKLSENIDKNLALSRTLLITVWIFIFFLLIFLLGFPIAVPLFVFAYLKIRGRERWGITIAMTALCWFFFNGLFVWLLRTPFEDGYLLSSLRLLTSGN